jgi:hypothetical protein
MSRNHESFRITYIKIIFYEIQGAHCGPDRGAWLWDPFQPIWKTSVPISPALFTYQLIEDREFGK